MYAPTPAQLHSIWECRHKIIHTLQDTIRIRVEHLKHLKNTPLRITSGELRSLSLASEMRAMSPNNIERSDSLLGRSTSEKPTSNNTPASPTSSAPSVRKQLTKAERILGLGGGDNNNSPSKSPFKHQTLDKACSVQQKRRMSKSKRPPKPPKTHKERSGSEKNPKGFGGMGSWVRDLLVCNESNPSKKSPVTNTTTIFQGTINHNHKRAFWPIFAHLILSCDYSRSQTIWEMRQLLVTILGTIQTTAQEVVRGVCLLKAENETCLM